jgi:nitrate reductase gamma subunit
MKSTSTTRNPELMASAAVVYQLHVAKAWLLYAVCLFSSLIQAWSIPFQFIGRPRILFRRRFALGSP